MQTARAFHLFEVALDSRHSLLDEAPVGFDLRLARTPEEAETAALAFQVGPGADKPRFLIGEMRELDLQGAFARAGALSEYLEDQSGAVDHLALEGALQVPLLHRRERTIDDNKGGRLVLDLACDLRDLARDEVRGMLDCRQINLERGP